MKIDFDDLSRQLFAEKKSEFFPDQRYFLLIS